MAFAYSGKILKIDLTTASVEVLELDEEIYRRYLGGSGLATALYQQNTDLNLAPLAAASPLFFAAGLLTGTPLPAACRLSVCAKSPLTGIWSESTVGGHFGAQLKATGCDALVITGRSAGPVYLWIDDSRIEIRSASAVWGRDTYETDEILRAETHPRAVVAAIGGAGEKQVYLASIMIGGREGRAAGRTGLGAVMGSKNLKAVVVHGTRRPAIKERAELLALVKEDSKGILSNTTAQSKYGTAGSMAWVESVGDLPIKNWREGSWKEGAERISGQRIRETIYAGDYGCFACPIRCGKEVRLDGQIVHGPEYETVASFGALCLNDDLESIVRANDLCNRHGVDTISTGCAIAFAVEAFETGLISVIDTAGLVLKWGDAASILALAEQVAKGEGFGRLLGQGTRKAAAVLGPAAVEMAVEVKGLEVPMHDPRAFTSMAVSYATANRGACHLESLSYYSEGGVFAPELLGLKDDLLPNSDDGKAALAIKMQNYLAVFNPLGLCKFLVRGKITPDKVATWLNLATGWPVTGDELVQIGQSLFDLRRSIAVAQGITMKDDVLPPRLAKLARPSGHAAGVLPDLPRMREEYYRLRGWSSDGGPAPH